MLNNVVDRIRSSAEDLIRDKRALIKVLSIAVILMLAIVFKTHGSQQSDTSVEISGANTETEQTEETETNGEVCVDIGGAVKNPGVYTVQGGTRLYEVIEMAGGLRSDADTDSVNQASVVEDGVKIIIPKYSEAGSESQNTSTLIEGSSNGVIVSDSENPGFVNINTADKEELKTLSGIGDVMADRIIEYRAARRFEKKEDIMSVKGIGSAIFEKIKDRIIV